MKIGIATPCHVDDQAYLRECLSSISNLRPQPFAHLININHGESSLHKIRTDLFDGLFDNVECDIVLSCDADFWLFPKILSYIERKIATDFCCLERRFFADLIMAGIHLVYHASWSGCYALPKEIWKKEIKPSWDGTDPSVKDILGRNYKFVKRPLYYALRPWRSETTDPFLASMSVLQRIKWKMIRLR